MKEKYYYHVTDEISFKKIINEGLKPMIGEQSKLVGEKTPAIYLCKRKDVGKWKILLQKPVVLQISGVNFKEDDYMRYDSCDEYLVLSDIPVNKIKRVYIYSTREQMHDLCLSYLDTISAIMTLAARKFNYPERYKDVDIHLDIKSILEVLKRLDYTTVSKSEIKRHLKEDGEDGEYTFCDTYLETNKRLWEQLVDYEDDDSKEVRIEFVTWMKENLSGCLKVHTGGWTG